MLNALDASVPFYSYRYQGHMLWDVTLPAVLGYVAALLYNQNNVAAEASPVTTWLEMLVGDDLCRMLGYYTPDRDPDTGEYVEPERGRTVAWGHITCDGSVANMEGLWAARNAKLYPLGLAAALRTDPALAPARGLGVRLPTGAERPLVELDTWELLNSQERCGARATDARPEQLCLRGRPGRRSAARDVHGPARRARTVPTPFRARRARPANPRTGYGALLVAERCGAGRPRPRQSPAYCHRSRCAA